MRRHVVLFTAVVVSGVTLASNISVWATETDGQPATNAPTPTEKNTLWNPLTWKWVPTEEEIQKYRRSWNPMTHGPILNTGIDIQPKGQFLFQPFVFGEIGHQQFGNTLSTSSSDSPVHLKAVAPTGIFAYGITDHLEWVKSHFSHLNGCVSS